MHLGHFEVKSSDLDDLGLGFLLNEVDTCLVKHNHIKVSCL